MRDTALATPQATAPHPTAAGHATAPPDEVLVHDHAPRHGGVVGMAGTRHVEVVLARDQLRVYPSDLHRMPLVLDHISGTVLVRDGQIEHRRTLARQGEGLVAQLPKLRGPAVDVRVELTTPTEPLLIEFTLPVTAAP